MLISLVELSLSPQEVGSNAQKVQGNQKASFFPSRKSPRQIRLCVVFRYTPQHVGKITNFITKTKTPVEEKYQKLDVGKHLGKDNKFVDP